MPRFRPQTIRSYAKSTQNRGYPQPRKPRKTSTTSTRQRRHLPLNHLETRKVPLGHRQRALDPTVIGVDKAASGWSAFSLTASAFSKYDGKAM